MQLSKNEDKAISLLRNNGMDVFSSKDLQLFLGNRHQAYNIIKSLHKKGHIKRIKKGLYCFKETDEMIIGTAIIHPSYISFLSALNYYGYTDQIAVKTTIATTRKKKHSEYAFACIKKNLFFGYISVNNLTIADKEKALIDSLYLPRFSGGMKVIIESFKAAWNDINQKKIYEYAVKTRSKIVIRRLGFLTESLGLKFKYGLSSHIGRGYGLFDPTKKRKGNYNKKWLLDVNI